MRRILLMTVLSACVSLMVGQTKEIHKEFQKYFDKENVQGSFSFYDLKKNKFIISNEKQFTQEFTPASTFKICNSLIGLETGVITDEDFVIKWDGVKRRRAEWNSDQDLKTAYKRSTVPYYQELARRVGGKRMKMWLDKANYGNRDTSGGIDKFWLDGGLRITPQQQLDFLKRLSTNQLPFSRRSVDIVKKIMIEEQTPEYILRTKTGWGKQDGKDIGWYVGYVEEKGNAYFFATCIQTVRAQDDFAGKRKKIARAILSDLRILPAEMKK
ncbi:MAG: class D beta-lactamase [bacterium]